MVKPSRGRMGICPEGKQRQLTFSICPKTKAALDNFCEQNGYRYRSEVINDAIMSYIQRNEDVQA